MEKIFLIGEAEKENSCLLVHSPNACAKLGASNSGQASQGRGQEPSSVAITCCLAGPALTDMSSFATVAENGTVRGWRDFRGPYSLWAMRRSSACFCCPSSVLPHCTLPAWMAQAVPPAALWNATVRIKEKPQNFKWTLYRFSGTSLPSCDSASVEGHLKVTGDWPKMADLGLSVLGYQGCLQSSKNSCSRKPLQCGCPDCQVSLSTNYISYFTDFILVFFFSK